MKEHMVRRLGLPVAFVAIIWCIHAIRFFTDTDLRTLGVFPRAAEGLPGILTAPLIHGSWGHLFYNSISFLILSGVVFWFYPRIALRSFILIYILSGMGVWLMAQPGSYHIGASGIVYGLVSLVFWTGLFRRNVKSIVLALIMLVLYAGYFAGIVPGQEGISWESHLLGALAGIVIAWMYKREIEDDELPEIEEEEIAEEQTFFLPRDIFEKKRWEE